MSQTCKVVLSISADMVGVYVSEILQSTTIDLRNEQSEEEADTLLELLDEYAKSKGIAIVRDPQTGGFSIPGIYDINGIKQEDMRRAGVDMYHAQNVGRGSRYDSKEEFEKCVLAIPQEVAAKVWGAHTRPIYVSMSVDKSTPVEITDPSKVVKDKNGNPVPQFKKNIHIGGYTANDDQKYMKIITDTLRGSGGRAVAAFWKKAILERLKAAAGNPKYLEAQLKAANDATNKAGTDKIDVSSVQRTRVTFQQTENAECDFVAIITAEYVWRPKDQGVTQKNAPNVGVAPKVQMPQSTPVTAPPVADLGQKVRV